MPTFTENTVPMTHPPFSLQEERRFSFDSQNGPHSIASAAGEAFTVVYSNDPNSILHRQFSDAELPGAGGVFFGEAENPGRRFLHLSAGPGATVEVIVKRVR